MDESGDQIFDATNYDEFIEYDGIYEETYVSEHMDQVTGSANDRNLEEVVYDGEFDNDQSMNEEHLDTKSNVSDENVYVQIHTNEPGSLLNKRKQQRSFTAKFKLQILSEYKKNCAGSGYAALGKRYGIDPSVIRRWNSQKTALLENDTNHSINESRRLKGAGRKATNPEFETTMVQWIQQRNEEGLQVKDKYILAKAQNVIAEMGITGFKASSGWLHKFKLRHDLVARRRTSIRKLPDDAHATVTKHISEVREIIMSKKIKPSNVLNMDQVPRYYEANASTTIIQKGAQQVLLRKAGNNHKRFTATFTVASDGKMLRPHILLSKLSRTPPNLNKLIMCAVNKTGMWSEKILDDYMQEIILKRPATSLLREPVLLLIDYYGPHVKLANSKRYEKHNVFIHLIPPGMTPLLQPLDVAINKSFQSAYNDYYTEYLQKAINDKESQTKSGNPKTPSHSLVSEWVTKWACSFPSESIKKAFESCGIGTGTLDPTTLHKPLRDLYEKNAEVLSWLEQNTGLEISDDVPPNLIEMHILPEKEASFFKCLHFKLGVKDDFKSWIKPYMEDIVQIISTKYQEFVDDKDKVLIMQGNIVNGAEISACCFKEKVQIIIHELNAESNQINETVFGRDFTNIFHFYAFEDYYSCDVE